jgi:hypothetical protein
VTRQQKGNVEEFAPIRHGMDIQSWMEVTGGSMKAIFSSGSRVSTSVILTRSGEVGDDPNRNHTMKQNT